MGTKAEAVTVIGEMTRISGKLEGGGDVRVKGHVEGQERVERTCLGCDRPFVAEGRFNRLCTSCLRR